MFIGYKRKPQVVKETTTNLLTLFPVEGKGKSRRLELSKDMIEALGIEKGNYVAPCYAEDTTDEHLYLRRVETPEEGMEKFCYKVTNAGTFSDKLFYESLCGDYSIEEEKGGTIQLVSTTIDGVVYLQLQLPVTKEIESSEPLDASFTVDASEESETSQVLETAEESSSDLINWNKKA